MPPEIAVGPPRLTLHRGHNILVTEEDGQIGWPTDKGLYGSDTRLISSWQIYANGDHWQVLNSGNISPNAAHIYLMNGDLVTETGDIPARALGLTISRTLARGLHEDLDLVNHHGETVRFNLEIAIRSDFADTFEVKSRHIVRRGRITTGWSKHGAKLFATYENDGFHREVAIRVRKSPTPPIYANGRISFGVELKPGEAWHACLLYDFLDSQGWQRAPRECLGQGEGLSTVKTLQAWRDKALKIQTGNEEFYRFFRRSVEDMAALRLPIEGTDHLEFVPSAGVPWFVGLFGRDSLVVSLQNSIVYPDFARGALDVLARYQATEHDDYRDAQPGKIMHELRQGELAYFKLIPHTPYYGTADATPLYLMVLHSAWRSIGDAALIDRHLGTAERCLEWIDRWGDLDGDGFQEYQTRSKDGYENQGWKDSGNAVVNEDGSLVKGPKALCELQGYVYDAWQRMAEIYEARGDHARASALRSKAKALFERFNEVFWNEKEGFYAFCLDGEKRPVFSVASNPGQCLWSGIVPPERAARVVRRLTQPDMWSGWGIRTLSAKHAAFNPYDYQRGSVWPHDNGLICLGFRRYGFAKEAAAIAHDVSEAAACFDQHRIPELYAGLKRTATNFPVEYKGANVPQAWAAGSCFSFLQAMTGLQPDAPNHKLYVDPALPDWMPDLTLKDLRIGGGRVDVRFWREGDDTLWRVIKGDAAVVEQRSCASGPAMPSGPRVVDAVGIEPTTPAV